MVGHCTADCDRLFTPRSGHRESGHGCQFEQFGLQFGVGNRLSGRPQCSAAGWRKGSVWRCLRGGQGQRRDLECQLTCRNAGAVRGSQHGVGEQSQFGFPDRRADQKNQGVVPDIGQCTVVGQGWRQKLAQVRVERDQPLGALGDTTERVAGSRERGLRGCGTGGTGLAIDGVMLHECHHRSEISAWTAKFRLA